MKRFNILIMSVAMLIAGLNFYFANCDAQSDYDLTMDNVECLANNVEWGQIGRLKKRQVPYLVYCPTCTWDWIVCVGQVAENSSCAPIICAHVVGKVEGLVPMYGD